MARREMGLMGHLEEDAESLIPEGAEGTSGKLSATSFRWKKAAAVATAAAVGAVLLLGRGPGLRRVNPGGFSQAWFSLGGGDEAPAAVGDEGPNWGCGLVGKLPGISQDGTTTAEMQSFIDAVKQAASMDKVSYWNWNLAPEATEHSRRGAQWLSSDFVFMPEQWGAGVVDDKWVREAGSTGWLDATGNVSNAQMAEIFLGSNEPDITGSCMGNMFGKCARPCSDAAVAAADCPRAFLDITLPAADPNADGECNCWQSSHATGVGFWPVDGCTGVQPLPGLWQGGDTECIDVVIDNWKKTAAIAYAKGYKYLSTPLVAEDMQYTEEFIKVACQCTAPGQCGCTDASCGCPVYVGFHFYAYDCRPESAGGYAGFQKRLDAVTDMMERYPFIKGAIINEVGMLNCAPQEDNPICVPNGGTYPATSDPNHACPANDQLPYGLATFLDKLFDMVIAAKTSSGKAVVKGFSWFNENMAGGTYNLELFNLDGSINDVGRSYMRNCQRWGESYK